MRIKLRHDPLLSSLNHVLYSETRPDRPLVRGIVVLLIVIFLIPYTIPGTTFISLGAYCMFAIFPLMGGVYLMGRKGGLITWSLISLVLTLKAFFGEGTALSTNVVVSIVSYNAVSLTFSLIAGHFCHMSRQLAKQARTDSLTGLPNYGAIIEQLEKEMNRACLFDYPLSLVFLDGDHYKQVNDTNGHAVGDVVLRQLGERIKSVLHEGSMVGRFGGDEFVVLLPNVGDIQASIVAEHIRSEVTAMPLAISHVDEGVKVTVSLGIATYPQDGSTYHELLGKADQAMYQAKELGRNQVCTSAIKRPNQGVVVAI